MGNTMQAFSLSVFSVISVVKFLQVVSYTLLLFRFVLISELQCSVSQ